MPLPLVARHVLAAQDSRELVYKDYNSKFLEYQSRGSRFDAKSYMELVASVTVHFSVISRVIITALKELERRRGAVGGAGGLGGIVTGVKSLQAHEAERLQLTASLHLSTVRLLEALDSPDETQTRELLGEEVRSMQVKLAALVEAVEEDKEEVREGTLEED